MSLAPIVSSPPSGDHQSHHQHPISALSPVESFEDHENQAERATVPRAMVLNDDDVLSYSSLHSSRVTAIGSSSSIAQAGSSSPTSQAAATPTPTRPSGRVVLQALETSPNGVATGVHLGGAAAGGVCSNFDSDSNNRLLSPPSRLPPSQTAEEASDEFETDAHLSLHGSTGRTTEACGAAVNGLTDPSRSDADRVGNDDDGNDDKNDDGSLVLPAPLALSVSPGNSGPAADSAESLPEASVKPRNSTTGAGGRPTIIHSPSGGVESSPGRGFVTGISSIFQRNASRNSLWERMNTQEQSSKKWSMLYSARSGKTVDYEDEPLGLDGHDSERARKNWRVLRAVFMALGKATEARV